jgi:hypothetical protein
MQLRLITSLSRRKLQRHRATLGALALLSGLASTACGSKIAEPPSGSPVAPSSTVAATSSATASCRLPLALTDQGSGFLSMPSGSFLRDPDSGIVPDGNLVRTQTQPILRGQAGGFVGEAISYDPAHTRWLPVASTLVAPGGAKYAYTEFLPKSNPASVEATRIHVVDVASGTDRVVYDQGGYETVHFGREGVYLLAGSGELWRLDPAAGAPTRVTAVGRGWLVTADAAWALDATNFVYGRPQVTDRVLRLDLKNASVTQWFAVPGASLRILGFDGAGHPVVDSQQNGTEDVFLVASSNASMKLLTGSLGVTNVHGVVGDDHGIWLGQDNGVDRYSLDAGLQKASSAVSGPALMVAGPCT